MSRQLHLVSYRHSIDVRLLEGILEQLRSLVGEFYDMILSLCIRHSRLCE